MTEEQPDKWRDLAREMHGMLSRIIVAEYVSFGDSAEAERLLKRAKKEGLFKP